MASSKTCFSRLAFFCSINLLFFTLVTATCTCPCPPESKPPQQPKPSPEPKPKPNPSPKPVPMPVPAPYPVPKSPPPYVEKCPRDALKIGVCAKLLNHELLEVILGNPPIKPCCSLIKGLADFEAALCLCTAIKTSILYKDFQDIPIALSLLSHNCGREIPPSFQCP